MTELNDPTRVDRIDVSKIKVCGHNVEVSHEQRMGVVIFFHPDGEPCSILNSLALTGNQVNEEDQLLTDAKNASGSVIDKIDNPIVYSRLMSDPELVKKLAQELDHEKDPKRLEDAFLKIAKGKNAVEVFTAIGKELGPETTKTILNNVAAVFVNEYRKGSVEPLQHLFPLVIEAQKLITARKNAAKDKGSSH